MPCPNFRTPVLVGLLGLAVLASASRGQPAPAGFTTPGLMMYAARYLGDTDLHRELNLTAEQAKKATALADGMLARTREATVDLKKRDELERAVVREMDAILRPEQRKRLQEVLYQQMERIPVGPLVLSEHKEFVKRLKLSEAQIKQLRRRTQLSAVLTEAQQKEWKKLQGAPYANTLRINRSTATRPVAAPATVQYLQQKPIQADLKLTQKQIEGVARLLQKWEKMGVASRFRGNAEERKKAEKLAADLEKEAQALLEPGQWKRLDQIILQVSLRGSPESDLFKHPRVVAELKLEERQKKQIETTEIERRKGLLSAFTAELEAADVARNVEAYRKETSQLLHAILSEAQRKQLRELIGEPFAGDARVRPVRLAGLAGGFPPVVETPLYLVAQGLFYVDSPDLQKELKLTKKQLDQLAKVRDQRRGMGLPDQARAMQFEKEVANILDAAQMKRFRELILQQYAGRVKTARAPVPTTLGRMVEVEKGLNLTAEQKNKVLGGTALETVLDEGQKAKWKEMLGAPFKGKLDSSGLARVPGDAAGPGRETYAGAPPLVYQALATRGVQQELKLSEAQRKQLPTLEKTWREKMSTGRRGTLQEHLNSRQAAIAELEEGCQKLLNADQKRRLDQIILQHHHRQGLNTFLSHPTVLAVVKLNEKQQERIAALRQDHNDLRRLFLREVPARGPESNDVLAKMTQALEKKLGEVLSDAQRLQVKTLLGEPFSGTIDVPAGRFGSFGGP